MNTFYTNEINTQLLIAVMKEHKIKKVIASPGTCNMPFVASIQQDPFFELYSCVDERSAAYMACGLSVESNEPVALSCTGATASRNYMSALTEAYYNKIPILAITSTQDLSNKEQNIAQFVDRTSLPNDIAKFSLHLPTINSEKDEKKYVTQINKAILELTHNGGGPVHINLVNSYSGNKYTTKELPKVKTIHRFLINDSFPELPKGKIGILVSNHRIWSDKLVSSVERFCKLNNAVVFVDHISNYHGNYAIFPNIVTYQRNSHSNCCKFDLMIYIGNIIGIDYQGFCPKEVWRVNSDGEVRDTFGGLTNVFQMSEEEFFNKYNELYANNPINELFLKEWKDECNRLLDKISDLPFSNIWLAQQTINKLPSNSRIHFGIQNSLRCWNFFKSNNDTRGFCNTGGFGIDGSLSSLIGASFANKDALYFGVIGDLSFFYDINSLGNKHIGSNLRLLVVNNGIGQQFKNPFSAGDSFKEDADYCIAAKGHFGNKSKILIKHFAEDLGFTYLTASNKEEYLNNLPAFLDNNIRNKSIIFEVFTDTNNESEAMRLIKTLDGNTDITFKQTAKNIATNIFGEKGIKIAKIILNK